MTADSGFGCTAQGSYWGANVAQDTQSEDWCMVDQGNGFYKVQHRNSGMFLDTIDASHGASVVLKTDSDSGNQQWRLNCFKDSTPEVRPCESVVTDKYCHIVAQHSQMALNVDYGSTSDGSSIVQYWESSDDHYSWKMVPSSSGNYKIMNKKSGLGLFANGSGKGDNVVQMTGGDDWCFINAGDGYYEIKNTKSGYALDIYKVRTDPQTKAVIWEWGDGQANRKFRLDCSQGDVAAYTTDVQAPADGCGHLDTCFLVDINTGAEQALTAWGKDYYSLDSSDKYTVRCGVNGNVDQFDFFYGDVRHSEWSLPYFMQYANDQWIQPVSLFETCGSKTFRVSGKTWQDGKCFEASYEVEAPCAEGTDE